MLRRRPVAWILTTTGVLGVLLAGAVADAGCRADAVVLDALQLRAAPLAMESDNEGVRRFHVRGLPPGHGYEPGRQVGLYRRIKALGGPQPVGVATVVEVHASSLEMVALWLEEIPTGAALEVGEIPQGHHFGSILGQILPREGGSRLARINMGGAHGVHVGDIYTVLGDAYTDTNLGGRSLGRASVGRVQVVEVGQRGQVSAIEVLGGEAPDGAYVVRAGHEAIQRRPEIRILVASFSGDRGVAYRDALIEGIQASIKQQRLPDIRLETTTEVIESFDLENRQAVALGERFRADVVVWGSASLVGRDLAVRPSITFLKASEHEERPGEPLKLDAEQRLYHEHSDELSQRVRGLAAYLAGLMYFTDFEYTVARSYSRAAAHFRTAIAYADPQDARAARVWLFYCLERVGDWTGADLVARAVERDGDEANDAQRQALGLFMQTRLAIGTGELTRGLALAERAQRLYTAADDIHGRAVVWGQIAKIRQYQGRFADALRIHREERLPVYERLGRRRSRALAMSHIADILYELGELDEALRIRRDEELPVYVEFHDSLSEAATHGKIADIYAKHGRFALALALHRDKELPIYDKLGEVRSRWIAMGKIAEIHAARGEYDEALRIHEQELPEYQKLGDIRSQAITLGEIADIYLARDQPERALQIREQRQIPLYEKIGDVRSRALAMDRVATIYARRGDPSRALSILQTEVLPVFAALGDQRAVVGAVVHTADIHAARDDLDKALFVLQVQLHALDERADPRLRAVVLASIADLRDERGESLEALRLRRDELLPLYDRLNDRRARGRALGKIAEEYCDLDDYTAAVRVLVSEEIPIWKELADPRSEILARGRLAEVHVRFKKLKKAAQVYRREVFAADVSALTVSELLGLKMSYSLVLHDLGNRDEAIAVMTWAAREAQKRGLPEAPIIEAALRKRAPEPVRPGPW